MYKFEGSQEKHSNKKILIAFARSQWSRAVIIEFPAMRKYFCKYFVANDSWNNYTNCFVVRNKFERLIIPEAAPTFFISAIVRLWNSNASLQGPAFSLCSKKQQTQSSHRDINIHNSLYMHIHIHTGTSPPLKASNYWKCRWTFAWNNCPVIVKPNYLKLGHAYRYVYILYSLNVNAGWTILLLGRVFQTQR